MLYHRNVFLIWTVFVCLFSSSFLFSFSDVSQVEIVEEGAVFDLLFPEEKEVIEDEIFIPGMDLIHQERLPKHVAIIMDGNRRWAKKNKVSTAEGHRKGANSVSRITRFSAQLGVKVLTLYAFSTENWSRSPEEVDDLMKLLSQHIQEQKETLVKNGIRLRTIGDLSRLPLSVQESIQEVKEQTSSCSRMQFVVALNYGSRDEIRRAITHIVEDVQQGRCEKEEISESFIERYLDTAEIGSPDLFIRTSGEQRLSNFLLWQLAYAELYITPVLWPDFAEQDLVDAILEFQKRDRRFGGNKSSS